MPELGCEECASLRFQLEQMIVQRKIPHAIIIEGEDPALNRELAYLIARAKLCTCDEPLSGECDVCRLVGSGANHPDIVEVMGSGKSGAIPVDTIRRLQTYGSMQPELADGIVYIMENGDTMLKPAQNAFLKLFEEPPENITFIITCMASAKLLETIRSRAVLLRAVWQSKPQENIAEEAEQAQRLALLLATGSEADTMLLLAKYSRTGKDGAQARRALTELIRELRAVLRQAMIINAGAQQVLGETCEAASQLARSLSPARMELMMAELPGFEQALKNNASLALVTSAMCVCLRKAAGK